MGTTYSNCQVHGSSQEAVVTALRGLLKEPAYISLSVGGWVGIYPEGGCMDNDVLAEQLSKRLAASVFSWQVYDSDVFFYTLYENGAVQDEFNSAPDYFEGQKADGDDSEDEPIDPVQVQGKPKILLPLCVPGTTVAIIQSVLHPANAPPAMKAFITFSPLSADQYLFANFQAADLARLLGIGYGLAGIGFRDIVRDVLDDYDIEALQASNFRLVGAMR